MRKAGDPQHAFDALRVRNPPVGSVTVQLIRLHKFHYPTETGRRFHRPLWPLTYGYLITGIFREHFGFDHDGIPTELSGVFQNLQGVFQMIQNAGKKEDIKRFPQLANTMGVQLPRVDIKEEGRI